MLCTNRFHHKNSYLGVTLIELMVVTGLLSMFLGIGSAFFSNFNRKLALKMAVRRTEALLKSARNAALQENERSQVQIYLKHNMLVAQRSRIAACWHFENGRGIGARGINCEPVNPELQSGKIGNALHFIAGKNKVKCGTIGRYRLGHNFTLLMWVYPERFPINSSQRLWQAGKFYQLGIQSDYKVYLATIGARLQSTIHLPIYRWSLIRATFSTTTMSLIINQQESVSKAYPPMEVPAATPMEVGNFFQGKIDEMIIRTNVQLAHFFFPDDVQITQAPRIVIFNRHGRLDPSLYITGLSISLNKIGTSESGRIDITRMGFIHAQLENNP